MPTEPICSRSTIRGNWTFGKSGYSATCECHGYLRLSWDGYYAELRRRANVGGANDAD